MRITKSESLCLFFSFGVSGKYATDPRAYSDITVKHSASNHYRDRWSEHTHAVDMDEERTH
jgi:hypothetical protein